MIIDKVKKVNKEEKRIKNEKASDMLIGKWIKCDNCKEILYKEDVHKNFSVCPNCGKHFRISARRLSGLGAGCPILAITDNKRTFRQLALAWNVTPIFVEGEETIEETVEKGIQKLKEKEILEKGDVVVLLGGAQTFSKGLDKKVLGGIVRV